MRPNLHPSTRRLLLLPLLLLATLTQLNAQTSAPVWYRSNDPDAAPFTSGTISPAGNGYALSASASFQRSASSSELTQSLASLDAAGTPLWSLASREEELILQADPASPTHAFAYRFGDQHLELARIHGPTAAPGYSLRYALDASATERSIAFLSASRVAVLQNRGSQLKLAVFDANGALVFENQYSSAGFLPSSANDGTTQSLRLHSIEGSDQLYLTVLKSQPNQSKPTYNNTVFALRIGAQGQRIGASSFAIETVSRTLDRSSVVGEQLLIALPDTTVGIPGQPFSSVPSTHLVLLSPSGSLAFAQTLEGFSYSGSPVFRDGDSLLVAGSSPNSSGIFATDAALAKLSATNGALELQAGFDLLASERLQLVSLDGQNRYATLESDDPEHATRIFFSLNASLQATAVKTAPLASLYGDTQGAPRLSAYLPSKAAIGSIPLDSDLNATSGSGIALLDFPYSVVDPQIRSAALSLSLLDLSVDIQASTPTLSNASFELVTHQIEHHRGTPHSLTSPISLAFSIQGNGTALLSFLSEYGVEYQLQSSDSPSGNFLTSQNLVGTGEAASFTPTLSSQAPQFFRVLKITGNTP